MFDDIGKRIKKFAKFLFYINFISACIISAILLLGFINTEDLAFIILIPICIIAGYCLAWLCGFLFYGFGELIDKTSSIESVLTSQQGSLEAPKTNSNASNDYLLELFKNNVITKEEFIYAIKKRG